MGLCVFSLPISSVMIERIYIYIYLVLLSSNRKYELLPIVYNYVMKQWFALYVFLYSYSNYETEITSVIYKDRIGQYD